MHRLANKSIRRFRRAESKSFLKDPETELEPKNFLKNPKIEMEFLEALKWVESIDESEAEMESPDAPRADGECDKDAERKNRRAGYKKKIRKRNTMRRAVKRTKQTTAAAAALAAATAAAAFNDNLPCMRMTPLHDVCGNKTLTDVMRTETQQNIF